MTECRYNDKTATLSSDQSVRYQAIRSRLENDGSYIYGLECLTRREGAWVQTDVVEDVSPSQENVLRLANRCNALALSPLHFRDVVLDCVNA